MARTTAQLSLMFLLFPLLLVALLLVALLLFTLLLFALLLLLQSGLSKHRRSGKQSQRNAKQEHIYAFGPLSKGFGS